MNVSACCDESVRVVAQQLPAVRAAVAASRAKLGLGTLPLLVAPPLLTLAEGARIASVVEALHRAFMAMATSSELVGALAFPDNARALAPAHDAARACLQICRLDALYDPSSGALGFVELQAGDPSGSGWCDVVIDALDGAGALTALGVDTHDTNLRASLSHRAAVLALVSDADVDPLVAFACPPPSFVVTDHEAMAAQYRRAGTRATRAAPSELSVENGRVKLRGTFVSAIVRDAPDDLDPVDSAALARALATGVAYVNPLADARFDDKRCFQLLRDPRMAAHIDDEAHAAITAHVPETVAVDDNVRAALAGQRAGWVLKPALGYGGYGVVVGAHVDDAAWERALAASRSTATVAQRALASAPVPWPILIDDALTVVPRYLTWSFWLHSGRFTAAFVRAGEAPIVNVHQGGGLGPVLFR